VGTVLAGRQSVTTTLLYFDGCPNWATLDDQLRIALRLAGRDDAVESRRVETIDGRDPFGDDTTRASLSCRIYRTPEELAGSPTVDQLLGVVP
jgi:hypothetical protein